MNLTLLIVVILTAIALVGIAPLASPASYLPVLITGKREKLMNAVFQPVAVRGCSSKPVIICLRSCS